MLSASIGRPGRPCTEPDTRCDWISEDHRVTPADEAAFQLDFELAGRFARPETADGRAAGRGARDGRCREDAQCHAGRFVSQTRGWRRAGSSSRPSPTRSAVGEGGASGPVIAPHCATRWLLDGSSRTDRSPADLAVPGLGPARVPGMAGRNEAGGRPVGPPLLAISAIRKRSPGTLPQDLGSLEVRVLRGLRGTEPGTRDAGRTSSTSETAG